MITDKGYIRRDYLELLEELQKLSRETLGNDVNLTNTSPLGMILQVIAWAKSETEERAELSYKNLYLSTAEGLALDNIALNYGDTRRLGSIATSRVEFEGKDGIEIPIGFLVSSKDGYIYEVDEEGVIKDNKVELHVKAIQKGISYNKKVGSINVIVNPVMGVTGCKNIIAATGGNDVESDVDFRGRVAFRLQNPVTGDNDAQYQVWAKEVEGVGNIKVLPTTPSPGYVTLIITDIIGDVANDDLIKKVDEHIQKLRPVGAGVIIKPAEAKNIGIDIKLRVAGGYNLKLIRENLDKKIRDYFVQIALKDTYVSYPKIGSIILSMDGVLDYEEFTINGDKKNINLSSMEIPILSELKVGV